MGDPALADESLIVPYRWKTAEDWGDKGTYFHVNGNYRLVIDNLLDLSHLAFVPPFDDRQRRGGRARDPQDPQGRGFGDRGALDRRPEPAADLSEDVQLAGRDDRRPLADHRVPHAGRGAAVHRRGPGRGGGQGVRPIPSSTADVPSDGFAFHNLNFVTPETESSTHYFWSNAYQVPGKPIEPDFVEMQYKQIWQAFHQDWEVFDLQQENWGRRADDRDQPGRRRHRGARPDRPRDRGRTGGRGGCHRGRVTPASTTAIRRRPGAALRFSGPNTRKSGEHDVHRERLVCRRLGPRGGPPEHDAADAARHPGRALPQGGRHAGRARGPLLPPPRALVEGQAQGRQRRVPLSRPALRSHRPVHPGSGPDVDPAGRQGQGLSHRRAQSLDLDLDGRPGGGGSRI